MSWPELVFSAVNWIWFLLGMGCLAGALIFVLRPGTFFQSESRLQRMSQSSGMDQVGILLWGMGVPALLVAGRLAQYANFQLTADSGNLLNLGWNAAHGCGLRASTMGDQPIFAVHFLLNTPLWSPFLLLWNSPAVYCVIQGAATGLSLLGIYVLAKRRIQNSLIAHLTALLAMAHPFFRDLSTTIIEDSVYALPFFIGAVYFWESERLLPAVILGMLALATKEEAPFMLLGMGIFLLTQRRNKRRLLGAAWIAGASVLWLSEMALIHKTQAQWPPCSEAWGLFRRLGGSPAAIVSSALRRPWEIAAAAVFPLRGLWPAARHLLFAGLFPVNAGAAILPFLVVLLPHQLAQPGSHYHDLFGYYCAFACGPLFWAMVIGIQRAIRKIPLQSRQYLASYILVVSACGFLTSSGYRNGLLPSNWRTSVPKAMAQIPPDAKVWCDSFLLPHCAMRRYAKALPGRLPDCFFNTQLFLPDRVLLSLYWAKLSDPSAVKRILDFLKRKRFEVVFQEKDLVLLANPASRPSDPPQWIHIP